VLVLHERKSRVTLAARLAGKTAAETISVMLTGNKPLATTIRQDILERTDGIPLFVAEITKAVLEAESEGRRAADRLRRSILGSGCASELARLTDGAGRTQWRWP
jgi:hypothetical protein